MDELKHGEDVPLKKENPLTGETIIFLTREGFVFLAHSGKFYNTVCIIPP
jgi:hypothetical protein